MSAVPAWLRSAAVVALCTLPLAAQEGDFAAKLFHSGERAFTDKAYKEALETWNQLLQSAPQSEFAPRVLLNLARYQVEVAKQPEAAFPYLDRLKTEYIRSPWAAEGLLLRGSLLARQARRPSDLKDAMAEFHRVIDLFPDRPAVAGAHLELGRAWRDQGQWGPAFQHFIFAYRFRPDGPYAAQALLEAAETLDLTGDLQGCLRLLQRVRTEFPGSPAAGEAAWRLAVRVKLRIARQPLRPEGPWPTGKAKWLKTPLLLAPSESGDVFLYQNGLDRAFRLKDGDLAPVGPVVSGARALVPLPGGGLWLLTRNTLWKEDGTSLPLGTLNAIAGGRVDRWGNLWVADTRTPALTLFAPDGTSRALPSPSGVALAPLPTGGVVLASDGDRSLHFLDADGQPKITVPYGRDLPGPFKYVLALASDPLGHVAALVDGGDFGEGVVVYGPDGAVLRQATLKALGLSGRFTGLALDRAGGVILCDRRNDTLFRLD